MIQLPKVIAGTSSLGNLYESIPFDKKKQIVAAYIGAAGHPPVFDTAGKYGAGLALEVLGDCLRALGINADGVLISNKIGWKRVPLTSPEPTFEPGVWKDLQYDAVQKIGYKEILELYRQGNEILKTYSAQLVSVHDPDEYLLAAQDEKERGKRYDDILEAYRALHELKKEGAVQAIGIGAKDWRTIQRISKDVALDWVMLANSLTIYRHPAALLEFVEELRLKNVLIINSALFHGGFLTGGNYFDYRPVSSDNVADRSLLSWRESFFGLCREFSITPASACIQFALKIPGISSIALNSTSATRTRENVQMADIGIPREFWAALKAAGLMDADYKYL